MIDQFSAEVHASYARSQIKHVVRERNAVHDARKQSKSVGAHATRPDARPGRVAVVLTSITKTLRLAH